MLFIAEFLTNLNDFIWSTKFLVPILVIISLYFTIRTKGIQITLLKDTFSRLGASSEGGGDNSVSSIQAFAVGLASRIGTGNLAGVAMALVLGGPGAIFWMWFIAIFGAVNAFIESSLAQLYKINDKEVGYRGGPAYYMRYGLKKNWLAVSFAGLLVSFYAISIIALQANTISSSITHEITRLNESISADVVTGLVAVSLAFFTAYIIFGGAKRVVNYSTVIVAVMSIVFLSMSGLVVILNISQVPEILKLIVTDAFTAQAVAGGTVGGIITIGFKRGLFSNEAGMGTAPNAAASANVKHPVMQGGIQALGVFVDTLVICTATAFFILLSGVPLEGTDGIVIAQSALEATLGGWSSTVLTLCIFFFAFSTILGIYFYGQMNYEFLFPTGRGLAFYKGLIVAAVFVGCIAGTSFVWMLGDLSTGLMATVNLIALIPLYKHFAIILKDYKAQLKAGINEPVFDSREFDEFKHLEVWHQDK
jgi:AGCS family alanine or glycine:cation symporter